MFPRIIFMYAYIDIIDRNIYNLLMFSHKYRFFKDLSQKLCFILNNYINAASWPPPPQTFGVRPETRLKVSLKVKILDKTGLKESTCFYIVNPCTRYASKHLQLSVHSLLALTHCLLLHVCLLSLLVNTHLFSNRCLRTWPSPNHTYLDPRDYTPFFIELSSNEIFINKLIH